MASPSATAASQTAPGAPRAIGELRNVHHSYGDRPALSNLSLEVRRGEVLGLLGPNGAGKTTAVRILCGLLRPSSGSAFVDGHDVSREPLEARRCMAFVPDGAPMYANLSPRHHLALVGRLHGMAEAEIEDESTRLLENLGLLDRIDDPVGQFSRGMRQKTALACAILPRPALLVLDEPLEGLDAQTTAVVKEILRAWADEGRCVLYTSHLLDVVERVCDRMAIVDRGHLVDEGSLDELRERSGEGGTLEEVFRAVTHAADPAAQARRVLGQT